MTAIDWDGLAEAVLAIGGTPTRAEGGLAVETEGRFRARIRSRPAPPAEGPLKPVAVLSSETIVPASRVPGLAERGANRRAAPALNRCAGAAAAMADGRGLRFAARVTLFEGDEAAWPLHRTLLAYASVWGASTALAGAERLATMRPPNAIGASAWTAEDLAEARAVLPPHLAAILDPPSPHAITANVALGPFRPPARLEVRADMSHPLHGPGLFASIVLPIRFRDEAALADSLAALNALEAEPIDAPPHYGAWAPDPSGRAAYIFFLPNGVKLPLVQNLVGWFALRARLAADALGGGEDAGRPTTPSGS